MVKGGAEFKQTWKYLYDDDVQLESASIVDNTQWRFSYDIRGNLISLVTRGIGKVIHTKYSKHRPSTVAHTFECVCSKINHGLNHGLFISLLKLINCPIH